MASLPYGADTNSQLIADMALNAFKAQRDIVSHFSDAFSYGLGAVYGYKVVKPEHFYKKSIMNRVIDLTVFYEQVMGISPQKLLVGYEEMKEIMRFNRASDMVGYSVPMGSIGMLSGMAVFQEPAKHHLECV